MSEEIKDQADAAEPVAKPEPAAEPEPAAKPEPAAEPAAKAEATPEPEAKADAGDQSKPSAQPSDDDDDDAVLNAAGRERPRFLLGFPQHPDLVRLTAAFEAGNYALVREEAEAVAERADSPAVRDAALELRRRIDPDPLAKYLLALTAALLLALAYFAYHH